MEEKREAMVVVISSGKLVLVGLMLLVLVAGAVFGGQVLFKALQTQPAQAQTRTASVMPGYHWYFAEGYTGPGYQTYLTVFNPEAWSGKDAKVFILMYGTNGFIARVEKSCPVNRRITVDINAEAAKFRYSGDISLLVKATEAGNPENPSVPIACERPMYFSFNGIQGGTTSTGFNY